MAESGDGSRFRGNDVISASRVAFTMAVIPCHPRESGEKAGIHFGQRIPKLELEKMLRERGWRLLRHGGRHDIRTDGVLEEAVPRHTGINERLSRAILRRVKKASAT